MLWTCYSLIVKYISETTQVRTVITVLFSFLHLRKLKMTLLTPHWGKGAPGILEIDTPETKTRARKLKTFLSLTRAWGYMNVFFLQSLVWSWLMSLDGRLPQQWTISTRHHPTTRVSNIVIRNKYWILWSNEQSIQNQSKLG